MIYIFNSNGNASVIYDGSTLTEEQKAQALTLETLEEPTPLKYQTYQLKTDGITAWWEYKDMDLITKLNYMLENGEVTQEVYSSIVGG